MSYRFVASTALCLAGALTGCTVDRMGLAGTEMTDASTLDAGRDDAGAEDTGAASDVGVSEVGVSDVGPGSPDGDVEVDAALDGGGDAGRGCGTVPTRTGLVLHYHARFGVTTESADDGRPRVVTWLDQSGGLNHGVGRDVVFEPDGLGVGRPSVRTQGLDESHVELRNPNVDDFTILVVMRTSYGRTASTWYDSPCILGGGVSGDEPAAALVLPDGRLGFTRQEPGGHAIRSSGRVNDGTTQVIAARRSGATGDVTIRVNGADFVSGTSTTGRIEQPSNWWIAGHEDHASGRLDASFGEVRVFDRQLSDAELEVVEQHLRCTWLD